MILNFISEKAMQIANVKQGINILITVPTVKGKIFAREYKNPENSM
jgi:hypothetical protein